MPAVSHFSRCCWLVIVAWAFVASTARGADHAAQFDQQIRPLLTKHCAACHAGSNVEGGIDLAKLSDDQAALRSKKLLKRMLAQVSAGEMPPADETQPTTAEREALKHWLEQTLARPIVIAAADRDPGRTMIHRLTRTQYNNTVRDLLGVDFDVAGAVGMPDESAGHSFDNLAIALKMPAVLLEKYFAAADKSIERFRTPLTDPSLQRQEALRRAAYDRLFVVRPGGELSKRQAARQIMQAYLPRAYRRPVEGTEVERYLKIYEAAHGAQLSFDDCVLAMLKASLVSSNFLLRIEENRAPKDSAAPYPVSDYELASRLSYFLWASMPDDRLFELASQGQLTKPDVLDSELRRMLADPKARALTDNFAAQWLQLGRLPSARPSQEFFPTLTPALRDAMREETLLLFDSIRRDDRSVLTLLNANYTYLNGPLAEHYGIAGVSGEKFTRVDLPANHVRGGLLGMASVLTINSHTFRTSPTLRGKWILEVVYGTPPPPPPANVSQIKDETAASEEAKNFRELLAQHAKDASCAACHKRIDPLGFGLENFDAIGRWRETHGGEAVDASGKLPSGEKFTGPRALKQLVLRRSDDFVVNVTEKMLIYALGRELESHDAALVDQITLNLSKADDRFSILIHDIATSYAFTHRRNLTEQEAK
ncbi:MAG TPA: DUF1592 domain-containing protein [Pirellulaceae bacterium]|nr:DUF1592 domain-containing protein [Pirellulaceae bacterium]